VTSLQAGVSGDFEKFRFDILGAVSPLPFAAAQFFDKPKLLTITAFFTYIRMAYPKVEPELMNALNDPTLPANFRSHLVNLQLLLQYFIPMVSDLSCSTFD
jgi:hypothetical protein